jgi:hypothetical protein
MSDTSAIDNKKKQQQTPDPKKDLLNFFLGILYQLIVFGILIIIGSLGLYSCRIAQANILPTCLSFSPYTDIPSPIKEIPIDINVVKTDKGIWSTKIVFPLEDNFKTINNTLGVLHNWINGPNSNVYKLYIATTLQQLIACNFTVTNTINNFMNSMLSESWLLILSPYILFFTGMLTSLINTIYFIILWFYNIYLFFSKKDESKNATIWTDGEMWGLLNWWWSLLYIFIFCILFFTIGIGIIIPISATLISFFCAIFPFFMKSKNSQTGKSYGLFETIKNVLKYKLNIIMILLSLYIVLSASNNFGGYTAFVAVVACIILYFFSSVYQQYTPKATDHASFGLGDFIQAEKICVPKEVAERELTLIEKIENLFGGAKRAKK